MTTAVKIGVGLGARAYDVLVEPDLIDRAGSLLRPLLKRPVATVVTDETVADLHGGRLRRALTSAGLAVQEVILPPGEKSKSYAGLQRLCESLLSLGLERSDIVVAFGGGVIGDLAGFAAAIFKRGVDFVQIPTTLLAQVDSSVGGKTAIDSPQGKNLIGAFHQPRLVLADIGLLASLPARQRVSGWAEVLKYGLLGDAVFFAWLEANGARALGGDTALLTRAVARSVEMKAAIVAADERETGQRALLNLGHTFGHALETETGFGDALLHGEGVGLGCALAFRFSARLGLCPPGAAVRAAEALKAAGLPTTLAELGRPFSAQRLLNAMAQDKKTENGELTFILAREIGAAFTAKGVAREAVEAFLRAEGADP
jgi:3-dehydroquinate synthase